jgi:signal transduction histidine kinase
MQLDTPTLGVAAVVVALIPAILGALVWKTRRTHPGRWALGNLLAALAMLFFCLRGRVPDWISIVVANMLAIGAGILFLQGIRQFRGLLIRWWPECLVGVPAVAAVIGYRYVVNDINVRILAVSLAIGTLGICCGITLLRKMPRGSSSGLVITGLAFVLWGAGLLVRGVYIFVFAPVRDVRDLSSSTALFFFVLALGIVSWSLGFLVLAESATQLIQFAATLEDAREEERKRIARELHDELGQVLTALKMGIEDLAHRVSSRDHALQDHSLDAQFQSAIERVDATIRDVRKIATELRPAVLDLGVLEAVEWLLQDFHSRTGIEYGLDLEAGEIALKAEQATAIFRILQEALTNVSRHSSATKIDVCLALNNDAVTLEVRDNGKGLSEDQLDDVSTLLGILGMRERARGLGGEATVRSHSGGGTLVRARIPHTSAAAGNVTRGTAAVRERSGAFLRRLRNTLNLTGLVTSL